MVYLSSRKVNAKGSNNLKECFFGNTPLLFSVASSRLYAIARFAGWKFFMRAVVILFVFLVPVVVEAQERRIGPPASLMCDRSELTLYDGQVFGYRRQRGKTFLRVRTSFDTTEQVTIRHKGTDDPSKFYLINGESFTLRDWNRIEKRKGVLKNGMHANIWVCRDNPSIQPVVDWRPSS